MSCGSGVGAMQDRTPASRMDLRPVVGGSLARKSGALGIASSSEISGHVPDGPEPVIPGNQTGYWDAERSCATLKCGTLPILQGLRRGDIHIAMEVWIPNQPEVWDQAVVEGAVFTAGRSLGHDWQSAFVIPAYLQEQYPELDSVEDLSEPHFREVFATTDTAGRARLISGVIGWACDATNAAQIEGYGLSEHVRVVNPGSGAALNADLYGAYAKQEPWLGCQWGTNEPALQLDLVRLQEPPFSEECWVTTKACAYPDSTIIIGVNSAPRELAPDVVAMLEKWDFDRNSVYKPRARWQDQHPDANDEETALWWLSSHPDVWSQWVTDEAESRVRAKLGMGPAP